MAFESKEEEDLPEDFFDFFFSDVCFVAKLSFFACVCDLMPDKKVLDGMSLEHIYSLVLKQTEDEQWNVKMI